MRFTIWGLGFRVEGLGFRLDVEYCRIALEPPLCLPGFLKKALDEALLFGSLRIIVVFAIITVAGSCSKLLRMDVQGVRLRLGC